MRMMYSLLVTVFCFSFVPYVSPATIILGTLPIIPTVPTPGVACYRNATLSGWGFSGVVCDWDTLWALLPTPQPVPTANDDVIIQQNLVLNITSSVTVNSFSSGYSTLLRINSGLTFTAGNLTMSSIVGSIDVFGKLVVNGVINLGGTLTVKTSGVLYGAIVATSDSHFAMGDGSSTSTLPYGYWYMTGNSSFQGIFTPGHNSYITIQSGNSLTVDSPPYFEGYFLIQEGAYVYTYANGFVKESQIAMWGSLQLDGFLLTPSLQNYGSINGSGLLQGPLDNHGFLAPGGMGATGTFTVLGSYTQDQDLNIKGVTQIELASSSDYDRIVVINGTSKLTSAVFNVFLINGYKPASNTQFNIITALGNGTLGGSFSLSNGNTDSGTFSKFTTASPSNTAAVVYDAGGSDGSTSGGKSSESATFRPDFGFVLLLVVVTCFLSL